MGLFGRLVGRNPWARKDRVRAVAPFEVWMNVEALSRGRPI